MRKSYGFEGNAEHFITNHPETEDEDILLLARPIKREEKNEPALNLQLSKTFFELNKTEDVILEINSNKEVEELTIVFLGAEAQPMRLKKLLGNSSNLVRLKFTREGKQELVVRATYEFSGKKFSEEKRFIVEIKRTVEEERTFKGYRILRLVSSGGFADIYEALDWSGRTVALKVYRGDDKAFIDEIGKLVQLAKKLGNIPYIVNVIDYGADPSPFVVMDYYPKNLRVLLDLKIVLDDYIKIMLRIAKTLAYASSIGVNHGDLKPENILIREESGKYYPAIADWGGGFTACYAAPEVYKSLGKIIMEKSDVWSFGVILYETLTQSRLFKNPIDYEERIKNDVKVELQQKRLENLINRCLLKDPKNRPSFRDIVEELSRYMVNELRTHISQDVFDQLSVFEIVDAYVEQGEVTGAEEGLKRAKEMGLISKDALLIMNKVIEAYKTLLNRRGKAIPSDEIKVIYQGILDLADEELKNNLKKDSYSLMFMLSAYSMITPELHEVLRICLDRMREIIVHYFLLKA